MSGSSVDMKLLFMLFSRYLELLQGPDVSVVGEEAQHEDNDVPLALLLLLLLVIARAALRFQCHQ